MRRHITDVIRDRKAWYMELMARLKGLDAKAILARGYALCSDYATGALVRSSDDAVHAVNLRVTFHDGEVLTEIKERIHEENGA